MPRVIRRRRRNLSVLFWTLLLSVGVRSLVAQGCMLQASDSSPLGFTIVLCDGLNGINAIEGLRLAVPVTPEPAHGLHGEHLHHPDAAPPAVAVAHEDEHQHAQGTQHFTATCGLWTAGAADLKSAALLPDHWPLRRFAAIAPKRRVAVQTNPLYRRYAPRAPPTLLFV